MLQLVLANDALALTRDVTCRDVVVPSQVPHRVHKVINMFGAFIIDAKGHILGDSKIVNSRQVKNIGRLKLYGLKIGIADAERRVSDVALDDRIALEWRICRPSDVLDL